MRARSAIVLFLLLCALVPTPLGAAAEQFTEYRFADPIDAVSITINVEQEQAVSAWNGEKWTPWQELSLENEQDPALRESNLVMLPVGTTRIRFSSEISLSDTHPVRVSSAPAQFTVAAAGEISHKILTRREWGADESLLVTTSSAQTSSAPAEAPEKTDNGNGSASSSPREQDCLDMRAKYPSEFQSSTPVTENAAGEKLRWPQQYSPSVRLLVVHHTAITVDGDTRPGLERMRALYQYHAQNRTWGDIGYHYVIDDRGQIYEGRAGGDSVVGGHVYCNNIGTVGIALMGNFDKEQPTQEQAKSLQWLLQLLGQKYGIGMSRDVMFHGKSISPIVGHRQLVSTDCPGTAMWSALDQVRTNVRSGNVDAAVLFPDVGSATVATGETINDETRTIVTGKDGLAALSETAMDFL